MGAARTADAHELVGARLVVRCEHHAEAGQHDVEGRVGVGQRLGALEGPLRRAVPSWFALSPFAAVPRPQPRVDNGGTLFSTDELRLP